MIEHFQTMAAVLRPWRPLLLLLAASGLVLAVLSVTENPMLETDEWMVPAVVGMLWSLVLYSLSFLFLYIPPGPDPGSSWWSRLSARVHRAGYWLLAILFAALSLALLLLTWQLIRVIFL